MQCKKCGAELPYDADYCFQCGAKVNDIAVMKNDSDYIEMRFNKKKIMTVAVPIALLLLFIAIGAFDGTSKKVTENQQPTGQVQTDNKEDVAEEQLSEDAIVLQGVAEVGEGKEIPPGKYEIRGMKETGYIYIHIIDKDTDYEEYINTYGIERNYLLKEGYILEVGYETAFTKMD